MTKLFISQCMRGRSDEEILAEREAIIEKAKKLCTEEVEVLNSFFDDYTGSALYFLSKSLEMLSEADIAVFGPGWEKARGCRIEHQCCEDYEIPIIEFE
ncbi:MAG: DUF4406 domain-containing protein [Ruminococcus sp.]|nr:DUF4406 domain-containing protein [Ruminococcus sp.]